MIDVALVGTGGMMPLPGRFLSSVLCRINGSMILFDCGEGTQVSLRILGWGFKNIDIIAFTHFHGDHISGLPGLLLTMANADRTEPVKLFGPPGLQTIVKSLCVIAQDLPFELQFFEINDGFVYAPDMLKLSVLPLNHRSPCFAYSLELLRRGKFDPDRAKTLNIPLKLWGILQKLSDEKIVYGDEEFSADMVLGPPRKGLKITICTDTRPVRCLSDFASESDLFICEGLYGDPEKQEKAAAHKHMTFQEAAIIAKNANVKELWLTHFSPAMPNPASFLANATSIFPNTKTGRDRMTKTLKFSEFSDEG